jgi:hypothetical protein
MAKKKRRHQVSDTEVSQAFLGFLGLFTIMGLAYVYGGKK